MWIINFKTCYFCLFLEIQRKGQTQTETQEATRTITCLGSFFDCYYRKSKIEVSNFILCN